MNSTMKMILNGGIMKESEAMISPHNRGMMYGDGCFETLRSYSGSFLGWDTHFERLKAGLEYLEIKPDLNSDELKQHILKLIDVNGLSVEDAMIRIQCWRKGDRGYKTNSSQMEWMIQTSAVTPDNTPMKLTLAEIRCIPSEALDRKYKLSNGLNYIKAAQEAKAALCDDALMLTVHDKISETTSANIFWVKENEVYTPNVDCDLLPGVTRGIVMEVIRSFGLELQTGEFDLNEVREAEAVFITNSLVEIKEILSLDDIIFEIEHPLVIKIKESFEQYKVQELKT
ncbi:MAG TPA: aminotransferase class IV [Gracilimonas sp.]|uniref:aminotransferase class IV n=1 Tax=Gracilimonas sp. TaxID=1974203 RepID=UPI002D9453BE|nr:aminotransferase class IV [Gracilimonas sp.]